MMLEVRLRHSFGAFSIDASFRAPPGLTVLFGGSGSGKTTIINAIAGLLVPDEGFIASGHETLLDTARGICLAPHRRRVGYVFQEGRLFPHLTVRQNLLYGAWFAKSEYDSSEFGRIVELLGITHLLARRPGALSGGEKQRVAIGRALLASPAIILADEPLASLDEARKGEILPYFERIRDEVSVPIVYVTHSAAEVARLATTVVALERGSVIRQGAAEEVLGDPAVLPLGSRAAGAVLNARVIANHADGLSEIEAGSERLLLPDLGRPPGSAIRVRISAHEVILARKRPEGLSALNIVKGRVAGIQQGKGPGVMVALDSGAGRILARITRRSAEALGLVEGVEVFAVIKSVGIGPHDAGQSQPHPATATAHQGQSLPAQKG